MAYEVKILADSISPAGHRLTTLMATFPRFILAEVNTTRMFSRNSASSRAIPVEKKIRSVMEDMFVPAAFGKNQKGMQHAEVLEGQEAEAARLKWLALAEDAIGTAKALAALGVHKQYANRVLEPFAWHTAIITATDWQNHGHQRVNPAAQGEYQTIATMMHEAIAANTPRSLREGDWHLPLILDEERMDAARAGAPIERLVKISVARCARVSYLTHAGVRDQAEDLSLYADTLAARGHMSPLEHSARPMDEDELGMTRAYDVSLVDGPTLRTRLNGGFATPGYAPQEGDDFILGSGRRVTIARVRGPLHYAGNLNGWISQRLMIHGEEDILGHLEPR